VAALLAAKVPLEVLRQGDSLGETCLHVAVCMGFQDVALRIVERGGAEVVGAQNAAGETLLMLAAGSLFGQLLAVSDGTLHCRDWSSAKQGELAMAFVDKAAAEALLIPSKEGTTCLQAAVLSGLTEVALKIMSRVGDECLMQWLEKPFSTGPPHGALTSRPFSPRTERLLQSHVHHSQ
jgi:hypothetical protein